MEKQKKRQRTPLPKEKRKKRLGNVLGKLRGFRFRHKVIRETEIGFRETDEQAQ